MGRVARRSEEKDWESAVRQSIQALPVALGFTALVGAMAWGLHKWTPLPIWLLSIPVFFGAFGVIGDAINVLVGRYKLQRFRKQRASTPEDGAVQQGVEADEAR